MKTTLKFIVVVIVTGGIFILGYLFSFLFLGGAFDKDYTPAELVENFKKKEKEIYALKSYFRAIVPKNKSVEIEFDGDNKLFRFGITCTDKNDSNYCKPGFLEWDIKVGSPKMDSLLSTLGWTPKTLGNLKDKLDEANCISIISGEPATIGFKRSGMGMYFFTVFDKPMSDSTKLLYRDTCTYIIASDLLVLEYGGGAVGPQCFYNK